MSTRTSGESSTSDWDVKQRRRPRRDGSSPGPDREGPDAGGAPGSGKAKAPDLEARAEDLLGEIARLHRKMEPLARFRAMIDGADEAIFLVDRETSRFVDANDTALKWFDITRDRLVSLSIHDVGAEFPLEHPHGETPLVNDTRDYQRPLICGRVHRRKDGSAFPVEVAVALRRFGKRTYTLVVARESRRRRESERTLRELDEKYQALFRLTRDAAVVCTPTGKITDANQALTKLLGYRPSEVIGREATILFKEMPPSGLLESGGSEVNEFRDVPVRLRKKDRSVVQGEFSWTPLGADGLEPSGFLLLLKPDSSSKAVEIEPARGAEKQPAGSARLSYSFLFAGLAVAAYSWTPVIELTYPYPAGLAVWTWGMRLLAPALAVLAVAGPRYYVISRFSSVTLGLVALVILAVCARYLQGLPYGLRGVVPGAEEEISAAMLSASQFTLAWVLFFGWLGWRSWFGPWKVASPAVSNQA